MNIRFALGVASVAALLTGGVAWAEHHETAGQADVMPRPSFEADGTVNVPAFQLPPSEFMSDEARAAQARRAAMGELPSRQQDPDVVRFRGALDQMMAPQVAAMRAAYAVNVEESSIADVPVRIITPEDGEFDRERVLINLHGGGFSVCWESCSMLESVPIAAVGDYRVVSVNYRMAPEARHPAAVQDIAKVYAALLEDYPAHRIGIYGCSAGGALTAQASAWFTQEQMPQPGALGIFGAGALRFGVGDSAYVTGYIDGSFPPPGRSGEMMDITRGYFDGSDKDGPIVAPALHPDMIAHFPPTLFITGTRAMDMSPAIVSNSALIKAGGESTLIVGEAMGHCYIYQAGLPEAQDAYQAIVGHFRKNLD